MDKQGNPDDVCNWRSISIRSVLRRVVENILDQRLKKYVSFNSLLKGFTNVPGTYIDFNTILNNVLIDAKLKKKDCCVFILYVEKAYYNSP